MIQTPRLSVETLMKLGIAQSIVSTSLALSVGLVGSLIASCSPAANQKVIDASKVTLDVGDAVCEALEDAGVIPDKYKIMCKWIDKADGLSHIFLATVPKETAVKMGAKLHTCSPATSSSR